MKLAPAVARYLVDQIAYVMDSILTRCPTNVLLSQNKPSRWFSVGILRLVHINCPFFFALCQINVSLDNSLFAIKT